MTDDRPALKYSNTPGIFELAFGPLLGGKSKPRRLGVNSLLMPVPKGSSRNRSWFQDLPQN